MFQPQANYFVPFASNIISLQESQNIRLQRLVQQRKRMEHMALVIEQQNQTIQILKQENASFNKQFYEIKLQNQLLSNKLFASNNHCSELSQVLANQSSLIQNLRGFLLGDLELNEYKKTVLSQQIQASLRLYDAVQGGKSYLKISSLENEMRQLNEQNQILNQKYESLCANYLELSKILKVKQFQLKKYQASNNVQTQTLQTNLRNNKHKNNHEQLVSDLIQAKDSQINELKIKIKKMLTEISHKDQLIREHRKNQKQQKKLLHHLKAKFHQQGKHIQQIAKSKLLTEPVCSPQIQPTYQLQKQKSNQSNLNPKIYNSSSPQVPQAKVFEQKNQNLNQINSISSSNPKAVSKVENSKIDDSGFKKTLTK